ncbi:MAG: hypothetical protein F7B20_04500 [Aeropyrum sp.]|nr:hypothetical protein [Aeropyrum sp.]
MPEIRLKLLPKEFFGRLFQYAFASVALSVGGTAVYFERDEIAIERWTFTETVNRALSIAKYALERRGVECEEEPFGIRCCSLDRGPQLYTVGARGDMAVLAQAASDYGLNSCKYISRSGAEVVTWTHFAISYGLKVLEEDGPLGGGAYSLPWLAKASLFSNIRTMGRMGKSKDVTLDIDSLGAMMLGGLLAYQGSHRVGSAGRGALEFYLLPQSPDKVYSTLLDLVIVENNVSSGFVARSVALANDTGASLEQALLLYFNLTLHQRGERARGLTGQGLTSNARIYTVSPGRRPQIRSGMPLSTSLIETFSGSTLSSLHRLWRASRESRDGGRYSSVVNTCLTNMYLQTLSPCSPSFAYDCARVASSIVMDDSAGESLRDAARRLVASISSDVQASLQRCGG